MGFGIGYCPRGVVLGVTAAYVDACLLGSWALPEAGPQHECPKEKHSAGRGVVCSRVPTMPLGGALGMSGRGGAAQQIGSEEGQPSRSYNFFPQPFTQPPGESAASPSPNLNLMSENKIETRK